MVSLTPGATATAEEILADVRGRLSSYKLPRQLHVAERVPRAPNGKADSPRGEGHLRVRHRLTCSVGRSGTPDGCGSDQTPSDLGNER
ncbi:MAG: hypothetical protein R2705_15635 [Ilumatobacteraceae bacterium]